MALSPVKTFIAGEVLTASDLNALNTNILSNPISLVFPATAAIDFDGQELILDADADTSITADTDDRIDIRLVGVDSIIIGPGSGNAAGYFHVNPGTFSITANTDYGLIRVGNTNPVTVPAGTAPIAAGVYIETPNWTATGTITETATLYVQGAATEGTNDFALIVDAGDARFDGNVTMPNHPAFLAFNSATDANVTGNSVLATADFDTEVFDQGANFATDTFTAPITGRYLLATNVSFSAITGTNTDGTVRIATSNRTYQMDFDPGAMEASAVHGVVTVALSAVADMDANDTVTVTGEIEAGSQDIGIRGDSSILYTSFSGCLLA